MTASWLPVAALALSSVLWGTSWIPVRQLGALGLGPAGINFAIFLAASILLAPVLVRRAGRLRRAGAMAWAAAAGFGLTQFLWNWGVLQGAVAEVVVLYYLSPVWASLLGRAFLGEAFTPVRFVALLAGLAGAVVVLSGESGLPWPEHLGHWMGIAAGVVFAFAALFVRKTVHPLGIEQTALAFVIATALGIVLMAHSGSAIFEAPPAETVLWAVLGAALWFGPATGLVFWAARHMDPGRVNLILLLEVVAAAASATLLAGEPFGWTQAAGCGLILVAGALETHAQWRQWRRRY